VQYEVNFFRLPAYNTKFAKQKFKTFNKYAKKYANKVVELKAKEPEIDDVNLGLIMHKLNTPNSLKYILSNIVI
jgi:hypothetical protein